MRKMTEKQKRLIDAMNTLCKAKFAYDDNTTIGEACNYIKQNYDEFNEKQNERRAQLRRQSHGRCHYEPRYLNTSVPKSYHYSIMNDLMLEDYDSDCWEVPINYY